MNGGARYQFALRVIGESNGDDRGRVRLTIPGARESVSFESTGIDAVAFSDDPLIAASRGRRPTFDAVQFSGTGKWRRASGYTFAVAAADAGEPGRGRDTFTMTVRDARGVVVATVTGAIASGNIESVVRTGPRRAVDPRDAGRSG